MSRKRVETLEDAGLSRPEAEETAEDFQKLESDSGAAPTAGGRISTGYLNTTNPETGAKVVFVPGEAIPEWAWKIQQALVEPDAVEGVPSQGQRSIRATARSST